MKDARRYAAVEIAINPSTLKRLDMIPVPRIPEMAKGTAKKKPKRTPQ
jgi:hypothetical protein